MSDAAAPITVMLVDDHEIVRSGIRALLETEDHISIVAEAADEEEAVRRFREVEPEVTLMDLRMAGPGGIETTRRIREEFPGAKIIMLTSYRGDEDIQRALDAGARGYLLKNVKSGELAAAIQQVAANGRYLPSEVAGLLAARSDYGELSGREQEVIELVAKGMSNKEIGAALGFSEVTAKAHMRSILFKLGASDRTAAAVAAIQRGLVRLD
jgi:two-component system, NarL family, response regulator